MKQTSLSYLLNRHRAYREFTKEMHVFVSKHPQSDLGVPVRPFRWLSPPGQLNLQPPACSK